MNESYITIMKNPENYWLRVESLSFVILVNKITGKFTCLYKRYGANLEAIKILCDKHPIIAED